jgi:hypothetical protein
MTNTELTELKYHLIIAKMKQVESIIFTPKKLNLAVLETLNHG